MMRQEAVNQFMNRMKGRARVVAAAAIPIAVAGVIVNPGAFFQAYLMSYLFWLSLSLGSLGILMVHHVAGGGWGYVIRRMLEAAARTLPLMALLFLVVVAGMPWLFEWTDPEVVADSEILQKKAASYLNTPFFIARATICFAVWIVLACLLTRWSFQQDVSGDETLNRPLRTLSSVGLVFYVVTSTFAAFDWLMSLDPLWFSSIVGPHFIVAHFLTAFAMMIALIGWTSRYEPLAGVVGQKHLHHLGNLLFACLMLWAYVTFSQFLIIWSGNLPDAIAWYLDRSSNGWPLIAVILAIFHFAIPFFILLSRLPKQKALTLMWIAVAIVAVRFVDLFWLIAPTLHDGAFVVHWLDFVLPLALGGVWFSVFAGLVTTRSILPLHDARFKEPVPSAEATTHG